MKEILDENLIGRNQNFDHLDFMALQNYNYRTEQFLELNISNFQ